MPAVSSFSCVRSLFPLLVAAWAAVAATPPSPPFVGVEAGKAQDIRPADVIIWEAFDARPQDKGRLEVALRMTSKQGFTVYASNLSFIGPPGFTVENVDTPKAQRLLDPISGEEVDVYGGGDFKVVFAGPADWREPKVQIGVRYIGCTQVICLFPYTQDLTVPVIAQEATPAASTASEPAASAADAEANPAKLMSTGLSETEAVEAELDLESRLARVMGGSSLWVMFIIVFVGGLLSNLTPCVYPMIPITLRVLARQGRSPYIAAAAYALGIVLTYSALGLVAALSGGMFGQLLASKSFNVTFAIVMALLGLSMLGLGDLSKLQALGSRLGSGPPSPRNAFLMGAGAGFVAAPCTGPILAALLAYTAKNESGLAISTLLMVCYSLGFALPYIALGGAAAKVTSVKVPPSVQVGVKYFFAAVMFALAFYYLRIPFYGLTKTLDSQWASLAAAGLIVGVVLLLIWTLSARLSSSKFSSILPSLILGIGIFSFAQWMTSVDKSKGPAAAVTWHKTEESALADAKEKGRPILIDMWATWCEACKKMDRTTFVDPNVLEKLASDWVVLKLDLSESTDANDEIQTKYRLQSLPTLVLLPADGSLAKMQLITGYVGPATLLNHLEQFGRDVK